MPTTKRRIGLVVDDAVEGALATIRDPRRDVPDAALARAALLDGTVLAAVARRARSGDEDGRAEARRALALIHDLLPTLAIPDHVAAEVRRTLDAAQDADALERRRTHQRALLGRPNDFGPAMLEQTERFDALEAAHDD